jgi:hypothetical protein
MLASEINSQATLASSVVRVSIILKCSFGHYRSTSSVPANIRYPIIVLLALFADYE